MSISILTLYGETTRGLKGEISWVYQPMGRTWLVRMEVYVTSNVMNINGRRLFYVVVLVAELQSATVVTSHGSRAGADPWSLFICLWIK